MRTTSSRKGLNEEDIDEGEDQEIGIDEEQNKRTGQEQKRMRRRTQSIHDNALSLE